MKEYHIVCPNCSISRKVNKQQNYLNNKRIRETGKAILCLSCSRSNQWKQYTDEQKESIYNKRNFKGTNNPFYGKKHTKETKQKLSLKRKGKAISDSHKNKIIQTITNNPENINRKPFYDCWVDKYGKEVADEKLIEYKKKQSIASTGSNNSMYGKPAPSKSGNGWQGWYKGLFFRSLRELSYIYNCLDKEDVLWNSAENNKYKISYLFNEKVFNYFPDYIVNNKYLVEIKPKRLWNTPRILAKKEAAEKFCLDLNLTYELIDPLLLDLSVLTNLIENNLVVFTDKTKIKYEQYITKNYSATGAFG